MTANRITAITALAVTCAVTCALAAGCGSQRAASPGPAAVPAAPPPLATSATDSAGAARAIVEMGGPAAGEDNFWELFVRPAGTAPWRLATPAGVADNGGLEVAGTGGSLVTGFRPSQDLTFSPLAASRDEGASWSPAGPVNPGLAAAPDALAAGPGGRLIALTTSGRVELGTSAGTAWTSLSSTGALAATPAGRSCGLTGLTGASFGTSGFPMLAGDCSRPGTVGIFADHGGTWRAAGPALPGAVSREAIGVLRLTAAGNGLVALLRAGSGPGASLLAAWSGDGGSAWTLSAALRVGAGQLRSTSVGPGGSIGIILNGRAAESLAGPGSSWRALPALPTWTATLALGPGGRVDAIAAHGGTFTDWRLSPGTAGKGSSGAGPARWSLAQTIHVTIPYGSSG
jgi:hypothetical protein